MRVDERELFFEGLGNVTFKKNPKAKRLVIRVKPNGKVSVTIPYLVSYREAFLFVEKKTDWIFNNLKRFGNKIDSLTLFKEDTKFKTVNHKVQIQRYFGNQIRGFRDHGILNIHIPVTENIESQKMQDTIRKLILETWRMEAWEILPKKMDEIAEKHNFNYSGLKIKNMKTRWGSCSKKNIINLNLHLVRLPAYLRDYILMHELVHTVHKNHGKDFWRMLNNLTFDAKKLAKELKGINIESW